MNADIIRSDSADVLEQLIAELNDKYQRKGKYDNMLQQLDAVDAKLMELDGQLSAIDDELFSDAFAMRVKNQTDKFNRHFSSVSNALYGEQYALKADPKTTKTGQRLYAFTAFNLNLSTGKKQGEISCFDIAYTRFADEEGIPCMHFLLNDKKELMHDNQLVNIARFVETGEIQFVASILKDKLPGELDNDEYVILKLSQDDKLFRIENSRDPKEIRK